MVMLGAYGLCEPAYGTVARVLRDLLDITGKRLTGTAYERDANKWKCDSRLAHRPHARRVGRAAARSAFHECGYARRTARRVSDRAPDVCL